MKLLVIVYQLRAVVDAAGLPNEEAQEATKRLLMAAREAIECEAERLNADGISTVAEGKITAEWSPVRKLADLLSE